jgi:predicted outer membrane repeat protein
MNEGTISGNTSNQGGGIYVESGTFIMRGGVINENTCSPGGDNGGNGGGVYVEGTFTMSGGTISGNTASSNFNGGDGGGVFVRGTFTMSGGDISGNTANHNGGGVQANTFTMSGGTISGNTAKRVGGGVSAGIFTKSGKGGVIYGSNTDEANRAGSDSDGHAVFAYGKKRNTTARAATAMDSAKDGPPGGWE